MSDTFKIEAERKYRRVYQGTKYTVTWVDATGEHKASSRNFRRLMKFVNNGFKNLPTWVSWYQVKVES